MRVPLPVGDNFTAWGNRIVQYLEMVRNKLTWKRGDETASDNGMLMWDETIKSPVVTLDGEFVPLVLHDGHAIVISSSDITPAAANQEYAITWDAISLDEGMSLGGSPTTRLVFNAGGTFMLSFSVQVTSSTSSAATIWLWPKVNGLNINNSTMKATLHNSSETTVLSRTVLLNMTAGDYIEAWYECDTTSITLESAPAATYAPATPSVTLSAFRVHQG